MIRPIEPGLVGIGTEPSFAIGQRALLVQTPAGNLLWDCISLVDRRHHSRRPRFGRRKRDRYFHPHYYASMIEWSCVFDAPVYLNRADQQWVMYRDSSICFCGRPVAGPFRGPSLIRCGGHLRAARFYIGRPERRGAACCFRAT